MICRSKGCYFIDRSKNSSSFFVFSWLEISKSNQIVTYLLFGNLLLPITIFHTFAANNISIKL